MCVLLPLLYHKNGEDGNYSKHVVSFFFFSSSSFDYLRGPTNFWYCGNSVQRLCFHPSQQYFFYFILELWFTQAKMKKYFTFGKVLKSAWNIIHNFWGFFFIFLECVALHFIEKVLVFALSMPNDLFHTWKMYLQFENEKSSW